MKSPATYELSLHHFPYIQKNLAELSLRQIPLTVPTCSESLLINSDKRYDPRRIVVDTKRSGRDFIVRREDGFPIQVVEANSRRDTYGQELFYAPLDYLALSNSEEFVWHVNTTDSNITDTHMLTEFVGILSTFALSKQLKLSSNS